MPRKGWRKPHLSTEKSVERLTKQLIRTLKKNIDAVYVKKVLHDPDNPHRDLYGLTIKKKIYIGKSRHQRFKFPVVSTLIHEIVHVLYPFMHEDTALDVENELYKHLIEAEKQHLKRYIKILRKEIPKHEVKHDPPK